MRSAVITGVTGFIGQALANRLLQEGWTVYGVGRNFHSSHFRIDKGDFIYIQANANEYVNLHRYLGKDIDCCFHLAWHGFAGKERNDYQVQVPQINTTCNLITSLKKCRCKKLIFAGTVSSYMLRYREDNPEKGVGPSCIYGSAKKAADILARVLCYQNGIDYNDAIFPNVFGVGDYSKRSTNLIITQLLKGQSPNLVEGTYPYDWFYIDNAVEGLWTVSQQGRNLERYYIGNPQPRQLREIITEVRDIVAPEVSLNWGSYQDTSHVDFGKLDTQKLYIETNFHEVVPFYQAIQKTAAWLKAQENIDITENVSGGGVPSRTSQYLWGVPLAA